MDIQIDANWRLTTEHFASSYGQPVLVDAAGNAYGPADAIGEPYRDIFGEMSTPTARQIVANWAKSHMPDDYAAIDTAIKRFAGLD